MAADKSKRKSVAYVTGETQISGGDTFRLGAFLMLSIRSSRFYSLIRFGRVVGIRHARYGTYI